MKKVKVRYSSGRFLEDEVTTQIFEFKDDWVISEGETLILFIDKKPKLVIGTHALIDIVEVNENEKES